jgi:tetratricopeptide (TPR) repeat protein
MRPRKDLAGSTERPLRIGRSIFQGGTTLMIARLAPSIAWLLIAAFASTFVQAAGRFDDIEIETKKSGDKDEKKKTEDSPAKPLPVESLGNPERLVIEGAATFSAAQIREALFLNSEVFRAADSEAPLRKYLTALRQKVAEGYQVQGFPDASATARIDERFGRVILHISEGPRYLAGDVRVEGNHRVTAQVIVDAMKSRRVPEKKWRLDPDVSAGEPIQWLNEKGERVGSRDPAWKVDEPAVFHPTTSGMLQLAVERTYEGQGYPAVVCKAEVVRRPEGNVADLLITVSDEGEQATVDDIRFAGNEKNTEEQLRVYLELKAGTPLTFEERARIERKLWNSARFLKWESEWVRAQERPQLRITLGEYAKAPSVAEPLTAEEEAALRLCGWLRDYQRRDHDLVIECPSVARIIVSPLHGIVAAARGLDNAPKSPTDFPYRVVTFSGTIEIAALDRGRKLCWTPQGVAAIARLGQGMSDDPEPKNTTELGIGLRGPPKKPPKTPPPPLSLEMRFTPVAFVGMVRRNTSSIEEGVLCIRGDQVLMRSDAASGRLLEFCVDYNESRWSARFEAGAFERAWEEHRAATAECVNDLVVGQPLGSLLRFLCDEPLVWSFSGHGQPNREAADALRALLARGVCEPLDKLVAQAWSDWRADRDFKIPTTDHPQGLVRGDLGGTIIAQLSGIDAAVRRLLPPYSSPYYLWHRWIVPSDGRESDLMAALDELLGLTNNGPVFELLVADALDRSGAKEALPWARQALTRLCVLDFHDDIILLLDPRSVVGQCALRTVDALRKLEPDEVEQLGKWLGPPGELALKAFAADLRAHPEQPAAEVLAQTLDRWWEIQGRAQVEARLARIEVHALIGHARYWVERGMRKRARDDVDQAIQLDPTRGEAFVLRAWLAEQTGDYPRALADYGEAVRLDPRDDYAWSAKAALLTGCPQPKVRNAQEAVRCATRACELTEWKQSAALKSLAAAYAASEDFEKAAQWQLKAVELAKPEEQPALRSQLDSYRAHKSEADDPVRR